MSGQAFALCAGAFLLGAIPFGYLAGKLKGIDLRAHGSGNIGATNALRVLGWKIGLPVLLLDVLKGYLPVLLAQRLALSPWWVVGAGLLAILGHTYSPFLGFRGGKGVATSLGVLIGLSPLIAVITLAAFILVIAITRYVSLGSLIGAVTEAICFLALPGLPLSYRLLGLLAAFFVILRHRPNIKRLLDGTESRLGKNKKPKEEKDEDSKKNEWKSDKA